MQSGTYQLSIGSVFYIGSSIDLRRRLADHKWRLRAGNHPVKKLQAAFDKHPGIKTNRGLRGFDGLKFTPTEFIRRMRGESDDNFRTRLRAAEQIKITEAKGTPGFANFSMNARGPEIRDDVRHRWKDPEFRAFMASVQKERLRNGISEDVRRKMAEAKTGAKNHNSLSVIVTKPDGAKVSFPTITAAAKFFKTSPQTARLWIIGKLPWPGRGKYVRGPYAWIADYSAKIIRPKSRPV